jgi:hypothetical protein
MIRDTEDKDTIVELSGDTPMPPQLQITVLLPHDPDTEAKIGRLVAMALAMNGRVVDIFPFHRPVVTPPSTGSTPAVGEVVPAGDTAVVGGRGRRGNSG